jgi:hypothetical protein
MNDAPAHPDVVVAEGLGMYEVCKYIWGYVRGCARSYVRVGECVERACVWQAWVVGGERILGNPVVCRRRSQQALIRFVHVVGRLSQIRACALSTVVDCDNRSSSSSS